MTWFKNLRTMTKLMLGFGFLALLLGVVGYQGIQGMSDEDSLVDSLYQKEMLGMAAIKDVSTSLALVGRQARGIALDTDGSALQQDQEKVEALFQDMDQDLSASQKSFVTEEGKALLAQLKQGVPAYRSLVMEAFRLAAAKDRKAALEALAKSGPAGDRVNVLTKQASEQKEGVAKQAYERSQLVHDRTQTVVLSITIVALLVALALGFFIAKLIANPLGRTVDVLENVAAGDLTQSLDVSTRDEIGQMSKALNAAVSSMRDALTEVRASADNVASASQQLASSSEELSSGAQEQASGLEETSASLEEITSSVRQNADSAKQANQLAVAARETAEKGGQVVSSAVSAMGEINTASKRIADIITTIDEIAFQTNLLALNAAVEAARAGEQGRGFAVVAAEVRSLAQRSATAAKEIKSLIQDSVRKVEAGSQMVNQSGDVLLEIVSSIKRVADIVGEIAAASGEQSAGVEQVAKAMSQMDQVTQQNASQTEDLSSTAQNLSSNADQLQALTARFHLDQDTKTRRTAVRTQPAPKAGVKKAAAGPKTFSKSLHNLANHAARAERPADEPTLVAPAGAAEHGSGFAEF